MKCINSHRHPIFQCVPWVVDATVIDLQVGGSRPVWGQADLFPPQSSLNFSWRSSYEHRQSSSVFHIKCNSLRIYFKPKSLVLWHVDLSQYVVYAVHSTSHWRCLVGASQGKSGWTQFLSNFKVAVSLPGKPRSHTFYGEGNWTHFWETYLALTCIDFLYSWALMDVSFLLTYLIRFL